PLANGSAIVLAPGGTDERSRTLAGRGRRRLDRPQSAATAAARWLRGAVRNLLCGSVERRSTVPRRDLGCGSTGRPRRRARGGALLAGGRGGGRLLYRMHRR